MDAVPTDNAPLADGPELTFAALFPAGQDTCLCTLILAACEPGLMRRANMSVTVLADTSGSISDRDLKHESGLVRPMEGVRRDRIIHVISFAQCTSKAERVERIVPTPAPAGLGTNLEQAVYESVATFPAGRAARTVILLDGRESAGNGLRYALPSEQRRLGCQSTRFRW